MHREVPRVLSTDCHLPYIATLPASRTLSKFLCPTYAEGWLGLYNSSFYMQCPSGETECVQLDLVSEEGNVCVHVCMREPEHTTLGYRQA